MDASALISELKFKAVRSSGPGGQNVNKVSSKVILSFDVARSQGLTDEEIRATFNKKVQMKVFAWNSKRSTDTTMTPLDSIKYHRQMMQSGFMVMDPVTGEVRAWVGGIDFKTYKLDHANLKTKRQVGSSIKPLLYCQAIEERGMNPKPAWGKM